MSYLQDQYDPPRNRESGYERASSIHSYQARPLSSDYAWQASNTAFSRDGQPQYSSRARTPSVTGGNSYRASHYAPFRRVSSQVGTSRSIPDIDTIPAAPIVELQPVRVQEPVAGELAGYYTTPISQLSERDLCIHYVPTHQLTYRWTL